MATTDTPSHHWQRLRQQTQELVEDLRAWVELRLTLAQMEIEERIETQIRRLLLRLLIGALAGLGAVFVLVAGALGLGDWLGHAGWGFLVVALGLIAVAAGLHFSRRRSSKAEPAVTPAEEPDHAANA